MISLFQMMCWILKIQIKENTWLLDFSYISLHRKSPSPPSFPFQMSVSRCNFNLSKFSPPYTCVNITSTSEPNLFFAASISLPYLSLLLKIMIHNIVILTFLWAFVFYFFAQKSIIINVLYLASIINANGQIKLCSLTPKTSIPDFPASCYPIYSPLQSWLLIGFARVFV